MSKQNLYPYVDKRYGAPYLHIHRADYHRVLVEAAQESGVNIQLGSSVTGIDFERPSVQIKGKPDFEADIVLGADGLKSVCRETLLGKSDPPHLTGDLAYRITLSADEMRKHELLKELTIPRISIWMGPDSHVVGYMLKGGDLYNVVLACPDNLPELVNTASADLQEMTDFFENWDPKLKALLGLVTETSKWRLQNSEEMSKWSHPSGKFALMGDACHATLPYLAQGAAMAIEDGAVLGALMDKIETKAQLRDVLVIYEKLRKERSTRVVKSSTANREIFHLHDGDRQEERDRQLLEEEPFDGFPNRWADPVFQPWLFGYDALQEVDEAWQTYKAGRFPLTFGKHRADI